MAPNRLDVALACNGLRMLMTMAAVVVAILILVPLPTWKRIVLLISVVPIALAQQHTPDRDHGLVLSSEHWAKFQGLGT